MTSIKNINQNITSKLETDSDTESEEELVIKIKKTTKVISESENVSENVSENESECESENESECYKKIIIGAQYIEYVDDEFNTKLGKFTFGLDKVIPWEDGNFILTGGLLYDVLTNNFSHELMDIDLFFYGSDIKSKQETLNKLMMNLDLNQYNWMIGYVGSVIYLFIQGIPRIIQLIMTDKKSPEEIVNTFDLTHVQMYYQNDVVYGTELAISQLKTKTTESTNTHFVPYRLIKYFEKGMNIGDKIFTNNNFIFSDSIEKLYKYKSQKKIYSITNNLTIYPDGTIIDFANWNRQKLDLGKEYFDKCSIYYTKPDNKKMLLDVNMVGKFLNYFHKDNIYSKKLMFNGTDDWIKNSDYTYERVDDNDISYSSIGNYYPYPNTTSILISNSKLICFYLPCEFIKYEDFYYTINEYNNDDNSIEKKIMKGIRTYFKLTDKDIINRILQIVDYEKIKSKINVSCELYDSNNFYRGKKTSLKKLLNDNNWDGKISVPFENTLTYPEANKYSHSTEFINVEDGLVIKSNIYNLKKFDEINEFNMFEKLVQGQKVHCMFKFFTYINYHSKYPFNINIIDINLQLVYIHNPK